MKRIFILFFSCMSFVLPSVAQGLRNQVLENVYLKKIPKKIVITKKDVLPDTLYCLSTKKQHGWFDGLWVVDYETARHHSSYFMLTDKNADGHWTKMKTMNAYGKLVGSVVGPYILKTGSAETDSTANKEWIERINTACQFEFIADPITGDIVQERAYDKDMNIVYTYSRVKIGERKYIGSYKDSYGLPAEMRSDSHSTYGTLVVITEDVWGNDSIVEYVDAKGAKKNNSDGVGMSRYLYDKNGCMLRQMSCDHDGNLVLDNWGNCGIECTYDNVDHRELSYISMDDKWEPIPIRERNNNWTKGHVKTKYVYDNYGRIIESQLYNSNDEPMLSDYGVHKAVDMYDDKGHITQRSYYDIAGNLVPGDSSGIAMRKNGFDSYGRCVYSLWLGKEGNPIESEDLISRGLIRYGDDDEIDEQVEWQVRNGVEDTCFYYRRTKDSEYRRWSNGEIRIDSLDAEGRTYLVAYYDLSGNPVMDSDLECSRLETEYKNERENNIEISRMLDTSNQLCNGKFQSNPIVITEGDTVNNTFYVRRYDKSGTLVETYKRTNDEFGSSLKFSDVNDFGIVTRSGGDGYYDIGIRHTQKGEVTSAFGRDEFNESDYISTSNGLLYCYKRENKRNIWFYDENNNHITDFDAFRDSCYKAMSIEVTDSAAYGLGLRDNDIIVSYGTSYQIEERLKGTHFLSEWTIAQVLEANNKKDVLVFRIDPETKKYGIKTIELPEGNPSDLGFLVHCIYRTQKQHSRLQEAISTYCTECVKNKELCLWKQENSREPKIKTVVVAFPEMYRENRQYPYPKYVKDPSIVISLQNPSIGSGWVLGDSLSSLSYVFSQRSYAYPLFLQCTKDMKNLLHYSFSEKKMQARIIEYRVTQEQYDKLYKLAKAARQDVAKERSMYKVPKPSSDSAKIYKKAVSQDDLDATLKLAECYHYGRGVKKSYTRMLGLLIQAETLSGKSIKCDSIIRGFKENDAYRHIYIALNKLDQTESDAWKKSVKSLNTLDKDAAAAFEAYSQLLSSSDKIQNIRKLALKGNEVAMYLESLHFQEEESVKENLSRLEQYAERTPIIYNFIGDFYFKNDKYEEAVQALTKADEGHCLIRSSAYKLAICYYNKLGITEYDEEKFLHYCKLAGLTDN